MLQNKMCFCIVYSSIEYIIPMNLELLANQILNYLNSGQIIETLNILLIQAITVRPSSRKNHLQFFFKCYHPTTTLQMGNVTQVSMLIFQNIGTEKNSPNGLGKMRHIWQMVMKACTLYNLRQQ